MMNFHNKHKHRDCSALKTPQGDRICHKYHFQLRVRNYRNFFGQREANEPITTQSNFIQPRLRAGRVVPVSLSLIGWECGAWPTNHQVAQLFKIKGIAKLHRKPPNNLTNCISFIVTNVASINAYGDAVRSNFEGWIWDDPSSNSAHTTS